MAITIADIGITQEELAERVVQTLADSVLHDTSCDDEGTSYSRESGFISGVRRSVEKIVAERANKEIDSRIAAVIDEILNGEFQPVDNYGDPKGEKTTLRDMIKVRSERFMNEKVNDKGNPVDPWSQSAGTRLELAMRKSVAEVCTMTVQNELKAAVDQAKKEIGGMVAKTIVEKLLK